MDIFKQIEDTGGCPENTSTRGVAAVFVATASVFDQVGKAFAVLAERRGELLSLAREHGFVVNFHDPEDPWHHKIDSLSPADPKNVPPHIEFMGTDANGNPHYWWNHSTEEGRTFAAKWPEVAGTESMIVSAPRDSIRIATNEGGLPFIISYEKIEDIPGWIRVPLSRYHGSLGD